MKCGCQGIKPITSSSHVFKNPESTKPDFFFHEICRLLWSVGNGFSFKNWNTYFIKCQYNWVFFIKNTILSLKLLQIENSGFVKTCDEYVHSLSRFQNHRSNHNINGTFELDYNSGFWSSICKIKMTFCFQKLFPTYCQKKLF